MHHDIVESELLELMLQMSYFAVQYTLFFCSCFILKYCVLTTESYFSKTDFYNTSVQGGDSKGCSQVLASFCYFLFSKICYICPAIIAWYSYVIIAW